MPVSPSFERLLSHVHHGDAQVAAEVIVARFAARLVALAGQKMSERLQQRVAPEDVVQSVFATFFRQCGDGRLELRDWESLWGLLARIAVWRIYRHAERHSAARRACHRETPLEDSLLALDREPTGEDLLIASDLVERLVSGLTEKSRPIVQQILDGATHEAIARELDTSLSTVERVHRRARERLAALLAEEEAA